METNTGMTSMDARLATAAGLIWALAPTLVEDTTRLVRTCEVLAPHNASLNRVVGTIEQLLA